MDTLPELPPHRHRLLNRSTNGFSPLMYLNIIQRGSQAEWVLLYRACQKDPETRAAVISLLEMGDPLQIGTIRLWADVLGVAWPDLDSPEEGI
ncbi:MAG TPA: hypothetical protein VNV15_06400 [Opitutaceae bacterium]|nr:hypothetical protein [Opitutaceae bacterium]